MTQEELINPAGLAGAEQVLPLALQMSGQALSAALAVSEDEDESLRASLCFLGSQLLGIKEDAGCVCPDVLLERIETLSLQVSIQAKSAPHGCAALLQIAFTCLACAGGEGARLLQMRLHICRGELELLGVRRPGLSELIDETSRAMQKSDLACAWRSLQALREMPDELAVDVAERCCQRLVDPIT